MSGIQRFTQVDAFADRLFVGNPAAVCVLSSPGNPKWMQDVDGFDLRWFTPAVPPGRPYLARLSRDAGSTSPASPRAETRPGGRRQHQVRVRVDGDRAHLGGEAITVLREELLH